MIFVFAYRNTMQIFDMVKPVMGQKVRMELCSLGASVRDILPHKRHMHITFYKFTMRVDNLWRTRYNLGSH